MRVILRDFARRKKTPGSPVDSLRANGRFENREYKVQESTGIRLIMPGTFALSLPLPAFYPLPPRFFLPRPSKAPMFAFLVTGLPTS